MRVIAIVALAAAVLASPAGAQRSTSARQSSDSTFSWSERIAPGAQLAIYNFSGPIDVRAASGSTAEVRAEKRVGRRGSLEDITFSVVRDGDDVVICALRSDRTSCDAHGMQSRRGRDDWDSDDDDDDNDDHSWRGVGAAFTVLLPKGVKLRVASGKGEVSVHDAGADVSATSGNGRVQVVGTAGLVHANSGNGDVSVTDAGGAVTARSGNGRVRVSTATGPVSATSGNGDIDVRMNALGDADDMEFRTGNGTVTVTLPAAFEGDVESSTGNGELVSDFPLTVQGRMNPRHVRATIGRGGRRLRMSSGNGNLELRKL